MECKKLVVSGLSQKAEACKKTPGENSQEFLKRSTSTAFHIKSSQKMHSLTRRLRKFYLLYVDFFKIFPISYNLLKGKFEVVSLRTINLLYFNVLFFGLHAVYYWTVFILLLKGSVTSDLVSTALLYTFGVGATLNFGVQARLVQQRKEWCQLLNTARETFEGLNETFLVRVKGATGTSNPKPIHEAKAANWEVVVQALIVGFAIVQPCTLYLFFWSRPRGLWFPTWVLYEYYQPHSVVSILIALSYSLVFLFQAIQTMQYVLVHTLFLGYILYSSLFWLQKCLVVPSQKDALKISESFHIYRCVYVYHQEHAAIIRYFLSLAVLVFIYAFGITSNYMLISFHTRLSIQGFVFLLNMSLGIIAILLIMIPGTASLYIESSQFPRVWGNYFRANCEGVEKKIHLAFIKSCGPVKPPFGDFFVVTKSSTYKMTLFLVLHTMKALLLFGVKEKGRH